MDKWQTTDFSVTSNVLTKESESLHFTRSERKIEWEVHTLWSENEKKHKQKIVFSLNKNNNNIDGSLLCI